MVFDLKTDSCFNLLYSVSDDRSLRVWTTDNCACITELYGHSARPFKIELANDIVISGGADQNILIWKWKNFKSDKRELFLFHKILLNNYGYIRSLIQLNSNNLVYIKI